jgi:hypothetical protein
MATETEIRASYGTQIQQAQSDRHYQATWVKYWEAFKDRNRKAHESRQIFTQIMNVKEN